MVIYTMTTKQTRYCPFKEPARKITKLKSSNEPMKSNAFSSSALLVQFHIISDTRQRCQSVPSREQRRGGQISKLSVLFFSKTQCLRELSSHKSVPHVANNSQSYMTDKIIWRRSFPNHFLIQHADASDTCVVQNCHNLRRGNIRQTQCDFAQLKCLSRSFFLLERLIGLVFAPFLRPAPPTGLCRVGTIQAGKVRLPFCGCPTNNCRRCDRIRDGRANVLRSVWSPI